MHPQNTPPRDVVDHLRARGVIDADAVFAPLRGGRTNLSWHATAAGSAADVVLKLYRADDQNPLFPNQPDAELAALHHLHPKDLAARALASGQTRSGRWLVYEHVPGECWTSDVRAVARVLAKLHATSPWDGLRRTVRGSREIAVQTLLILSHCAEGLRDTVMGLRPTEHVAPAADLCLIHGDPVPGNMLVDDQGVRLIDWQCPALGDPCEDLALFLSPAMQYLYRGQTLSVDEQLMFLSAYPSPQRVARYRALRPWFGWRMVAYCAWRETVGDQDYAEAARFEIRDLTSPTHLPG